MTGIEKLKNYIKEEETNIPKELLELIDNYTWINDVEKVGENNRLTEEEILALQVETALFLIGITTQSIFANNIETNVVISEQEAQKIAEEIDQKVFKPIYKSLTEKIKTDLKSKKPTWNQNIGFVLSNGDWTIFLDSEHKSNKEEESLLPKIDTDFITKKDDIRNKFKI